MSYQVLARKWRPRSFASLVGQAHVVRALTNALDQDRVHHAFLFTGTRGVGKTTLARIFAKALNCQQGVGSEPCGQCASCQAIDEGRFVDLIEVDAASRTKVEDTRELLENVQYAPSVGRFKVYLIDEVHMLSTHSFNALLKTLEEPPPHIKFLLATTDPQKLPVTVLSRCLQFSLKRLPADSIAQYLAGLLEQEGIAFDGSALPLLARAADGSMRDALSLLDQAIAFGGGEVRHGEVESMLGSLDQGQLVQLMDALADGDGESMLSAVDGLAADAADFDEALADLLTLLQRVAIVQQLPSALSSEWDMAEDIVRFSQALSAQDVQLFYQIALNGRRDLPMAPDPRAGFEMVLLRMLAFVPLSQPSPGGGGSAASGESTRVERGSQFKPTSGASLAGESISGKSIEAEASVLARGDAPAPVDIRLAPRDGDAAPVNKTPPSSAAAGLSTADAANRRWHADIDAAGLTGMARELAANAQWLSFEGGVLRLAMAANRIAIASDSLLQKLGDALSKHYGEAVKVLIEQREPDQETLAVLRERLADERQQAAQRSIKEDPLVQMLERDFDARVEPGSIRPH